MSKIKTTLFWLSALAVGTFFGVKHEMENRAMFSVKCMIVTAQGPVQTIQFEDERVHEENGVIKGKTKLYRLNHNEACLIEEIEE